MSKLYSSEYKEINVNFLLKSLVESKILILIVTLFMTFSSAYWAYSIDPVYKSQALIKIGHYHVVARNGDVFRKSLDSANHLTKELSYLFVGQGDSQASIVRIISERNEPDYVEIVSEGSAPEHTANAIKNLVSYVQNEHSKILSTNREQITIALKNTDVSVSAITKKQERLLSKETPYKNEDYESLLNTIELMSIIDIELGFGYISQILERKEKLELLLGDDFEENTALVGEIQTPSQPFKPRKNVIVFSGFFLGIFLSVAVIFLRKFFSAQHTK